jgi:formylmethanofuran dehydrogenase subunit C
MELNLSAPQDCVGDFTYNFIWQHKGERLKPADIIPSQNGTSYTYEEVVEVLKHGEDVFIEGDAGKRLGSSLGVDLVFFGGNGKELSEVGSIIIDGSADSNLGLSMLAGAIYVRGEVQEPLGNIIQVESDRAGYKKFVSITWLLHHPEKHEHNTPLAPNEVRDGELMLADGLLRHTLAARCMTDAKVNVKGNVGISVGILMRRGAVVVSGNAGMNAAALLNGGTVVILGNAAEFLGVELRKGVVFVKGSVKGYVGAQMTGGRIICKRTKPLPPVRERKLEQEDLTLLARYGVAGMLALSYGRYEV